MGAEYPGIGDIDVGIAGRHEISGTAGASRVEYVDSVPELIISAVGVAVKDYLCADSLCLLEKLVGGIFYRPLVAVGEKYLHSRGRDIDIIIRRHRSKVTVAADVEHLFVEILGAQPFKVTLSVTEEDEQIGVAVSLEDLVHSGIVTVGIRKNDYPQSCSLPFIA